MWTTDKRSGLDQPCESCEFSRKLGLVIEHVNNSQKLARSLLKENAEQEGFDNWVNRVMLGDCSEWKLWGRHPLTSFLASADSFGGTELTRADTVDEQ